MKAIVFDRYGPPDVLHLAEVDTPRPDATQVLIKVHASSVSTADWRIRASAFPGILWLPGRLMMGLFKPKNPIPGVDFAGEVVGVGEAVTQFAVGDRVFGFKGHGGNAEYLVIDQAAAIVRMPKGIGYDAAAALPFGGLSALVFMRDVAKLRPGMEVLVIGASGGVGVYAVQIARAMGTRVTGVCSAANAQLVRDLGAEDVIDYQTEDATQAGRQYDVVFDTIGAVTYAQARRVLRSKGAFVPLNFGGRAIVQSLVAKVTGGPRLAIAVSGDTAKDLQELCRMVGDGQVRPVIDRSYSLARVAEAHAYVQGRRRRGAVIVEVVTGDDTAASVTPAL
ncbi:MAG: NAD(P)-dependent alcohol dehydrogenase [Albidovulum sp.]